MVDASLLVALGARVGDEIALGEARFVLRATVENMPGDVGVRSAFGPRVFIPRARVEETGLLSRGSRANHEAYLRLPPGSDAQEIADRFRSRLSAERLNVRTVSDDQRRLTDTLSRFGNFLGLVALVALLLGGLGVASAVHVFIKQRLATVAVLRCLGATGGTVLAAYLVQAAFVGLLGSLVGAALGAGVQLALPRLLKDVLPVDVAWSVSWPSIAGGVGIGVWVALVFSLLPLLAVRRVSPLAVLRRDYEGDAAPAPGPRPHRGRPRPRREPRGAGRDPGGAALLRARLRRRRRCRRPRLVALRRPPRPGPAPLLPAAPALPLPPGPRQPLPPGEPDADGRPRPRVRRLPAEHAPPRPAQPAPRSCGWTGATPAPTSCSSTCSPTSGRTSTARVSAQGPLTAPVVPIVPMRIQSLKGRPVAELLAIEDETQRPERWALRREYRSSYRDAPAASERLLEGAWWRAGEWKGRADGSVVPIAVDEGLARELKVALGDEIVWDVQGVPVPSRVAVLRDVEWARFEPNFFVVFPEGPLDAAPQSYVLLSRVEEPEARARLQRSVVEAHPNVSTLDLAQVQRAIESVLDKVVLAIRFMALFSLAAGAVVLAGAVAASRFQRVREGALLRTLGARRSQLLRILLAEYAVLGALAAGAAILLSTAARVGARALRLRRLLLAARPGAARAPPRGARPHARGGPRRQHRGLAPPAPRGAAGGVTCQLEARPLSAAGASAFAERAGCALRSLPRLALHCTATSAPRARSSSRRTARQERRSSVARSGGRVHGPSARSALSPGSRAPRRGRGP